MDTYRRCCRKHRSNRCGEGRRIRYQNHPDPQKHGREIPRIRRSYHHHHRQYDVCPIVIGYAV